MVGGDGLFGRVIKLLIILFKIIFMNENVSQFCRHDKL